jgi:acetyl esterase/lipase
MLHSGNQRNTYSLFQKYFMANRVICFCFSLIILVTTTSVSQTTPTHRDIVYAIVDGKELKLDLYLPSKAATQGLLVWVHGGAWRGGTKDGVPKVFPENGIPTASIEFRQSTEARFPAQIHDIKAAIRFLARIQKRSVILRTG